MFHHPDDIWSPINKPTDPCQVHGCQRKKHNFPLHHLHQDGKASGTLSRWCLTHTIDKGFCHRCGLNSIWHKDIGMCYDCEKDMYPKCALEGVTVKQFVDEMKKRADNDYSPFRIVL